MSVSQEEFIKLVGENLAKYRKFNNYTQIALAEKLNYSDKAISKWENGECLPEIYVLKKIADLYGVTVNDLITPRKKPRQSQNKVKAFFTPALSCCIAWIVALLAFFLIRVITPTFQMHWYTFILAIPTTFIIIFVFSCIYKNFWIQILSLSAIIWTTILTIHIALIPISKEITTLYFLGIPLQVIAILWYTYRFITKKKQQK